MTKKHFIALADAVRGIEAAFRSDAHQDGETINVAAAVETVRGFLADFCKQQNGRRRV